MSSSSSLDRNDGGRWVAAVGAALVALKARQLIIVIGVAAAVILLGFSVPTTHEKKTEQ